MDLAHAAAEVLSPLGYEVLELDLGASGKSRRVLLRIDRLDETVVSMEDVERASEVFGLELDRLDPFEEPYRLEVESPGGQRPLVTPRHFERFSGLLAKVRTGSQTFRGRITSVQGNLVTFDVDGEQRSLATTDIDSARLAEWPSEPR